MAYMYTANHNSTQHAHIKQDRHCAEILTSGTYIWILLIAMLVGHNYLLVQTGTILTAHPLLNKSQPKTKQTVKWHSNSLEMSFLHIKKSNKMVRQTAENTVITFLLNIIDFHCPPGGNIPEMKSIFYWFALKENRDVSISSFYGPSLLM